MGTAEEESLLPRRPQRSTRRLRTVAERCALCSVVGEMADATDPLLDVSRPAATPHERGAGRARGLGMEVYRTLVDSGSPSEAWDAVTALDEKDARRALLSAVLNEISRRRQPI